MKKSYSDKLKDPRWQKKRLEIFERDKWECKACGKKDKTLHVHHFRYKGEPWEADDEYLLTLCEDCHSYESVNQEILGLGKTLKQAGFLNPEIYFLSKALENIPVRHVRLFIAFAFEYSNNESFRNHFLNDFSNLAVENFRQYINKSPEL